MRKSDEGLAEAIIRERTRVLVKLATVDLPQLVEELQAEVNLHADIKAELKYLRGQQKTLRQKLIQVHFAEDLQSFIKDFDAPLCGNSSNWFDPHVLKIRADEAQSNAKSEEDRIFENILANEETITALSCKVKSDAEVSLNSELLDVQFCLKTIIDNIEAMKRPEYIKRLKALLDAAVAEIIIAKLGIFSSMTTLSVQSLRKIREKLNWESVVLNAILNFEEAYIFPVSLPSSYQNSRFKRFTSELGITLRYDHWMEVIAY